MLRSKATRVPYAKPCDLWSLGVATYMLLSGRRPFNAGPKGDGERERKIELILHSEPSTHAGPRTLEQPKGYCPCSLLLTRPTFDPSRGKRLRGAAGPLSPMPRATLCARACASTRRAG